MDFEFIGDLSDIETIAAGRAIHDLPRLRRLYGMGYRRKMKGSAPAAGQSFSTEGLSRLNVRPAMPNGRSTAWRA